ncbi:MAG: hypothetical protein OEO19_20615 [Gammaproteobacteria bacterium]|nr:hypothetical protein [Gammaproteobacteria bacterium]MDH3447035.1 hypothetical protein [Gammaproteobacteria bacterium]
MSRYLGKPFAQAQDGENNAVIFDLAYPARGRVDAAVAELRQLHGDDIRLLPMSGTSCGGGIFQVSKGSAASVIGLRFDPPPQPLVRSAARPELTSLGLDEIVIDADSRQVCAGASITLDQLNRALAQELGHGFRVPGADLTSYQYAAVGATFMTGGMGPQRRYFSDSVVEASIFDGVDIIGIGGSALQGYAGTYGWSGIVSAVRCDYYRFPENEIAFALPVVGSPLRLARLLARLAPYAYLELEPDGVRSSAGQQDLILGVEHVSVASMRPLLRDRATNAITRRARELEQKCAAAAADGLVFVNGCSARSIDEFLLDLADEGQSDDYSIAGIGLEFADVFNDPEEMRALREAIPYAARMQSPAGGFVYKNHTDANIRIPVDNVGPVAQQLWQINRNYVDAVERHFDALADVDGEVLVYGHLNPYGIDPHNRVTMSSDDETAFAQSRGFLVEQRAEYYRMLAALCENGAATFIGGEKTADSELGIYAALGGPENSPTELFERFRKQRATVRAARPEFNWRAPETYR